MIAKMKRILHGFVFFGLVYISLAGVSLIRFNCLKFWNFEISEINFDRVGALNMWQFYLDCALTHWITIFRNRATYSAFIDADTKSNWWLSGHITVNRVKSDFCMFAKIPIPISITNFEAKHFFLLFAKNSSWFYF